MSDLVKEITCVIVKLLAESKFAEIEQMTQGIRLSGLELKNAVDNYGCKIIYPPQDQNLCIDVIEVKGKCSPQWSVVVPLWTKEEGRSDLTLELTVKKIDGIPRVEIDDLHVL